MAIPTPVPTIGEEKSKEKDINPCDLLLFWFWYYAYIKNLLAKPSKTDINGVFKREFLYT
jgi:hypothetical protein